MLTFDLHYHPNIANLSKIVRDRRLERHRKVFEWNAPDCVACTEHSYKHPLDAYLYLADSVQDLDTAIIPGVECVSREGVEIVYLHRNEQDLRNFLKRYKPFSWSIKDVGRIRDATGAVTVVPHPFSLARSGAGNVLSPAGYARVLKLVDYVEIHNGSALTLMQRISTKNARPLFKKTMEKISWTLNLPREHSGEDLGWAVSSDAHFPEEQFIIGSTEAVPEPGETYFDMLNKRIRFDGVMVSTPSANTMTNNMRLFRNVRCAMSEGINKDFKMMRSNGLGNGVNGNDKFMQRMGREFRRRAVKVLRSDR